MEKSFFISSLFMAKDLFCKSPLNIQYIFRNKINAIILVDTSTTRYGFIDEKFMEIDCKTLGIEP